MSSTDIFYTIGDLMQSTFVIFEIAGNTINFGIILLGFFGFGLWMNYQRKTNAKATVPVEIKDNKGWYKEDADKKILK